MPCGIKTKVSINRMDFIQRSDFVTPQGALLQGAFDLVKTIFVQWRKERYDKMPAVSVTVVRVLRELAAESPVSVRVSGECMVPLLANGAMIRVVRRRFYWPGDPLVVHAVDGRLLVHRLLGGYAKGRGWRWLTQADLPGNTTSSVHTGSPAKYRPCAWASSPRRCALKRP